MRNLSDQLKRQWHTNHYIDYQLHSPQSQKINDCLELKNWK